MLKRGISRIIAAVLMILISLVAITIVWLFVQPSILEILSNEDGGSAFGRFLICSDLDVRVVGCNNQDDLYSIKVERGAGGEGVNEVKFELVDIEGRKFILSNESVLGEYESKIYSYNTSDFTDSAILSVDVAGIIGGNACGFSGLPVSCFEGTLGFEEGNGTGNETLEVGCEINKGIVYLGDFEDNCTRIRNGLINPEIEPIPNIGFHSVGASHLSGTSAVGAKFHRIIISWHTVYDENGQLRQDLLDGVEPAYRSRNTKILLTIKPNDPNRSTCSYEIGERGIDESDSYPKNETEWTEYVKFVVDKYYVQPVNNGQDSVIAGIQLGNEWSHQFVVNTTDNPTCNPNLMDSQVKLDSMIKMMNLTYSAMQEAQEGLNPGEKKVPMLTFGVTGVDNHALKRGFNLDGKTYAGYFENGIREVYPEDINENVVAGVERFIVDSSPYYDYLDIHLRGDYYQDPGYVAQWIRDLWDDNGISGKGLSATEYRGPFHLYTTEYQRYYISSSLAHSFHQGFDAIAWASWTPTKKLFLTFSLEAMTDWNNNPRQYARDAYKKFNNESAGYEKIRLVGSDTYIFLDSNDVEIGRLNVSQDVPSIPLTYEQCSDGLDNDNDGLNDSQDDLCGQGNFTVDVEFNESGIYF